MQEFDAFSFAKSQRQLKILLAALIDKNERFLSEFQYINTIGKDQKKTKEAEQL